MAMTRYQSANDITRLLQHLIGIRRRNPWLHTARSQAVSLENTQYVYRTEGAGHALVVALNASAVPFSFALADAHAARGRILAGSGAPVEQAVERLVLEPQGWAIIAAPSHNR